MEKEKKATKAEIAKAEKRELYDIMGKALARNFIEKDDSDNFNVNLIYVSGVIPEAIYLTKIDENGDEEAQFKIAITKTTPQKILIYGEDFNGEDIISDYIEEVEQEQQQEEEEQEEQQEEQEQETLS